MPLVLVAASGGADSMALAAATAFVGPRLGIRVGGVVVDHQLQPGSGQVADRVSGLLSSLGLDPVRVVPVVVTGPGGPEAAARTARRVALQSTAEACQAQAVLLGHTLDDQAETVLLRLSRGSGARSLAGMRAREGLWRRPFLRLRRDQVRQACGQAGLPVWEDPHNADRSFARVRVRLDVLPVLEEALGPGVADALARSARLLGEDADLLDARAAELLAALDPAGEGQLDAAALAAQPTALRRRVLRLAAIAAGAPAGHLTASHVEEVDRLVTAWHGQVRVDLPGRVGAQRRCGRIQLARGPR